MSTGELYSISPRQEHSSVRDFLCKFQWPIPADDAAWGRYRKEAREILDKASKDTNPMGIGMLIAAVLVEYLDGYNGKENQA